MRLRPLSIAIVAGLAGLCALGAPLGPSRTAVAADGAGAGVDCAVRGKAVVEKGVVVWSDRSGGTAIAGFSTQEIGLELTDFPADPSSGRAHVRTGKGSGSFRIEGWIDATKVPLAAKNDVPVVAGHVWIGRGQPLRLRGAEPGKLVVETTLPATGQTLKAKSACTNVAVGLIRADEPETPDGAKQWVLKGSSLELFGEPGGAAIFTVEVAGPGMGLLLFSSEPASSFVHVRHLGALGVDAYAKLGDLKAFPKGEMLDSLAGPGMVSISPAKLKVDGAVKQLVAPKDAPLRLSAGDAAKAIGTLEAGAEVTVLDVVGGWARVYPKALEILPPDGKDFWVKATDLGL